jgi:hypothetical protein
MSPQKPGNIKNFEEAIAYIRHCLNELGERTDEEVAASIVGLGVNDLFEEWYKDNHFAQISDTASSLEWSDGSPRMLVADWKNLEHHLALLEDRYKN